MEARTWVASPIFSASSKASIVEGVNPALNLLQLGDYPHLHPHGRRRQVLDLDGNAYRVFSRVE